MQLRSKLVVSTKVAQTHRKKTSSILSIENEKNTELNRKSMLLRSKSAVSNDENHANKRFKRSKPSSETRIERKKLFIENEQPAPAMSVNVSTNEKLMETDPKQLKNDNVDNDGESATNRSRSLRPRKVQMVKTLTESDNRERKTENRIAVRTNLKRSDSWSQGNVVLVKWPSYPYWPARITSISEKNVEVIFFGDNDRTAKVKKEQIYDFDSNMDYIIKTLKCRQWKCIYTKAIREAEIYIGVPLNVSLINHILEN